MKPSVASVRPISTQLSSMTEPIETTSRQCSSQSLSSTSGGDHLAYRLSLDLDADADTPTSPLDATHGGSPLAHRRHRSGSRCRELHEHTASCREMHGATRSPSSSSSMSGQMMNGGDGDEDLSPLGNRRQREIMPESKKDERYWERRRKNNEAAKRSREKRRMNDILMEKKIVLLSQENVSSPSPPTSLRISRNIVVSFSRRWFYIFSISPFVVK